MAPSGRKSSRAITRGLAGAIGANRVVLTLSLARFGDAVGNSILFVILPLYVGQMPYASWLPLAEEVRVGILISLFGLVTSMAQPLVGAWSDRMRRRKPLIQLGLVLMAAGTLAFTWVSHFGGLLLLRIVQGLGVALTIPASLALMAQSSTRGARGGAMGIYATLRMSGLAIGPLLGGLLHVHYGFDEAFYLAAGFILAAILAVQLWVVEEPRQPPAAAARRTTRRAPDRRLWHGGLIGVSIASFVMASSVTMIAAVEKQLNIRLDQTAVGFGIAFSALMLSRLLTQIPFGWLSDRVGRKPLIVSGLVLLAPATALLGVVTSTAQLTGLRLVQGVASAAIAAPGFALAADLAGHGAEARQMSIVTMGFGLGMALGPLLTGVLAARLSFEAPFLAGGALALAGAWIVHRYVPETVDRGQRA